MRALVAASAASLLFLVGCSDNPSSPDDEPTNQAGTTTPSPADSPADADAPGTPTEAVEAEDGSQLVVAAEENERIWSSVTAVLGEAEADPEQLRNDGAEKTPQEPSLTDLLPSGEWAKGTDFQGREVYPVFAADGRPSEHHLLTISGQVGSWIKRAVVVVSHVPHAAPIVSTAATIAYNDDSDTTNTMVVTLDSVAWQKTVESSAELPNEVYLTLYAEGHDGLVAKFPIGHVTVVEAP